MNITVEPDLASIIDDMVQVNGFDLNQYVNGLLEKGIRADLQETYTEASVREFMTKLQCDPSHLPPWNTLKETTDPAS